MIKQREKYLHQIMQEFSRYGIKSVTMDDISKNLGISKKTLYKVFKDKDEIVTTLMEINISEENKLMEKFCESATNAIEETYSFAEMVVSKLKNLNPSLIYDLEKYHPNAWEIFNNHKRQNIYRCIFQNIERGIKEGIYRKNLNSDIVAKLFSEKLEMIFNEELFPRDTYSFSDIHNELISYHLKGIVSKEGLRYLKENE